MNRSRISRSIISVIFVTCCLLMLFICVKNSLEIKSTFNIWYKVIYLFAFFASVGFYLVLKRKLNQLNCKKSVEYSYRYIYIVMIVLITRFMAVLMYKDSSSLELIPKSAQIGLGSYIVYFLGKITLYPLYATIIVNTLLTFITAIIIKRLVFNITTNEIISAIASISYIFIPNAIINTTNYARYNFNTLFVVIAIYLLLKIIDEVKQHKLKTKKYLVYTCFMGVFIFLDILFGGRFEFWIIVLLGALLISNNVGYVRLKNNRDFVEKINSVNARKFMYKMETITLNKLLIVFAIVFGISLVSIGICYLIGLNVFDLYLNINLHEIYNNMWKAVSSSKNYYIVILIMLVILELLCTILKRKKDTKTSLIKLCTIVLFIFTPAISDIYSLSILDVFLSLSLILNIGNIYYNRDEKIKLLKAEN